MELTKYEIKTLLDTAMDNARMELTKDEIKTLLDTAMDNARDAINY